MPASQPPSHGPEPMRIAPNLNMEDTKLTPTTESGRVARPHADTQPTARRDAFGNRISSTPSTAPPRYERRVRNRRSKPVEQPKPGLRMNRTLWLAVLAVAALLVSLAL